MDRSQSFEIQNTQNVTYQISTTAITETELSIVELPPHIHLSPTLTPKTHFLVAYKAVFTDKYIQALLWKIPIVNSRFLYSPGTNYKAFEMKPFQGVVFSTSGIADEIYSNYFILLGAVYEQNCSIFVDFLICDNENSEKFNFCKKYEIPVIKTSQVFGGNYRMFKKLTRYDAKQLHPKGMFLEKTFFLDPKLPKKLFNKLRRIIIENEGTRVSLINEDTDYVITLEYAEYKEYSSRVIYYQYVFDCIESNSLIYPEFYRVHILQYKPVLPNTIAVVDKTIENASEYIYKLKSLGSTVKSTVDVRTTHYFTRNNDLTSLKAFAQTVGTEIRYPFQILTPEWIDPCIALLKHVKETRFNLNRPVISLKRKLSLKKDEEMIFQFTGLSLLFKEEAIKKFQSHGIRFVDSEKFEKCTHLIMGTLSFSEKFFCSLVSGCWILTPNFIQDFENQPNFDFEKYEWVSLESMTPKEKKTVDSIKRWRIKIHENKMRPFRRWNAKLYCPENKLDSYRSLILAGGGLVNGDGPYTHVFVDKSYTEEVKEENTLAADSIFSYLFK